MISKAKQMGWGGFKVAVLVAAGMILNAGAAFAAAGAEEAVNNWFDDVDRTLTSESLEINPRYRQELEFDNNILLSSDDEDSSFIFREVPGIELIAPHGDHFLRFDYEAVMEQFTSASSQNDENQYAEIELALNFAKSFLRVQNDITHTSSRAGTTFQDRVPRFENRVEAEAGYSWNRYMLEILYEDFYRSFDQAAQKNLNYHSHKYATKLAMDLTAKIQGFIQYAITEYNYSKDSSRDGIENEVMAGIRGDLLPKTSVYASFGYERVDYSRDAEKDSDNFVSTVGLQYKATERTQIDLGWVRDTVQATFSTANDFQEDRLFMIILQQLTEKLVGRLEVSYTHQDYEESAASAPVLIFPSAFVGQRKDDIFVVEPKLIYQFTDNIKGDVRYQFARRDSNASAFDYSNHIITSGLTIEV